MQVRVRRMEAGEEKLFLELKKGVLYPFLSKEAMEEWIKGEGVAAPLCFVLVDKNEGDKIIGGLVLEIQDFLGNQEILLQLDIFFVLPEYRRKGWGTELLCKSLFLAGEFYSKENLRVSGLLVQTTGLNKGAANFYRNFCRFFSYCQMTQKMGTREVTIFLISLR